MKKIIILFSIILLVFLTFMIIYDDKTDLDIEFVDNIELSSREILTVCVMRQDGKLVLIDVEKHKDENIYVYILKLYDHYRNNLPLEYSSTLEGNIELKKLEKKDDKLFIELDVIYLKDNFNIFLNSLMWSYQLLGINELELKAGKEVFYLKKNSKINLSIESYSKEASEHIVFHYFQDEVLPITYIHSDSKLEFIMDKILSRYKSISYTIENLSEKIVLTITDPEELISDNIIESIEINFQNLNTNKTLIIIINDSIVRPKKTY